MRNPLLQSDPDRIYSFKRPWNEPDGGHDLPGQDRRRVEALQWHGPGAVGNLIAEFVVLGHHRCWSVLACREFDDATEEAPAA